MISNIEERLGPTDILVNNAGMSAPSGLDDIIEERKTNPLCATL
jgi:NADP-dependent 3-hydroxy acid dehydrogenase YdfG